MVRRRVLTLLYKQEGMPRYQTLRMYINACQEKENMEGDH